MPIKITRKMLSHIYHSNSVEDSAKKLGISVTHLYALVDRFGIKRKGYPRKIEIKEKNDALGQD